MYGNVRLEINQFVNHRQNGISFCFSLYFQPAYIFRSFLATRQPNLTGRTSLFLLSLINRNAHNNKAHSAGHKNMNKVCLFLFVCLSRSLCLSVAFFLCFACQLAVNRLADKNVKCRPELASQSQPPLAALQLADCNLHRSSTALQSRCLPACGLSHVPCTFAPCSNYLYFLSTTCFCSASRKFQSETCAALFCFFFCCFGLALISDQGQCSLTETT